jgi:hypothetical protein
MSALKAEEAELLAAQKAEHSKTPGKTGLIAKLTGKEDPVKKAEKQELKAEIARAEESTKAAHDYENAQLKANKTNDMAAVNAADKLHGSHSHATGVPMAGGELARGENHVLPADKTSKLYNHATGAHGQAALVDNGVHHHNHHHGIAAFADNGLGDRHGHDHHHHDDNHNGGLNQGGMMQGGMTQGQGMAMPMAGGVPIAMMPVAGAVPIVGAVPIAAHGMPAASGMPLATHGAPLSSVPLASHGAPLASSHTTYAAAPLASSATHVAAPMSSTGTVTNVAVLAPSHSHNGNRL